MNGGMANGTEKIIRLIWLKLANQWPILQLVAFQMLGDSYVHQVLDINILIKQLHKYYQLPFMRALDLHL